LATFLPKPNFPKRSHPSYPRFRINLMVPLRLARSARNQGSRLHFGVENIDQLVSRLIGLAWGEKPRRPRCARRIRSSRLERPITPWARISVIISRSPDGDKYRLGALAVDSRGVPARDALAERFTSRYSWMPATMALPSCRVTRALRAKLLPPATVHGGPPPQIPAFLLWADARAST